MNGPPTDASTLNAPSGNPSARVATPEGILDLRHWGLFRVDVLRLVLDLPHKDITDHCVGVIDAAPSYTTFGQPSLNDAFVEGLPAREKFERLLRAGADEFLRRSNRKPLDRGGGHRVDYWCSVYREHDQHGSHIHQRSLISGTYYPSASQNSTAIMFEAPWINHAMHDTVPVNQMVLPYKPDPGDCLMWPSWLNHRVEPQGPSDTPRIAISFNIDYAHEPDMPPPPRGAPSNAP